MIQPSAYALWKQAQHEYPGDSKAARDRYLDLLRESGHIERKEPYAPRTLPCGYDYGR